MYHRGLEMKSPVSGAKRLILLSRLKVTNHQN